MNWYKISINYESGYILKYFVSSYHANVQDFLKHEIEDRLSEDENIKSFKISQASSCEGCRNDFPGQEAHMGSGGCLENLV